MILTAALYNRPEYTRSMLDHLAACRGIGNSELIIRIEPGCDEVIEMARSFDACKTTVSVNEKRLGSSINSWMVMIEGYQRGDFVVFVEEDILLAPDSLDLLGWCRDEYRKDEQVFSVTTYNRVGDRSRPFDLIRRDWFHGWGTGIWRDRFELARLNCDHVIGYDAHILFNIFRPGKFREIAPYWSRSQNIGSVRSVDRGMTAEEFAAFHKDNHHVNDWSEGFTGVGSFTESKDLEI